LKHPTALTLKGAISMIFIDNKYTTWYYSIISRAQARTLPTQSGIEKHHIIPESFFVHRTRKGPPGWVNGDSENANNIVKLTAHEHFVCHLLLTKMTVGVAKAKAAYGFWRMVKQNNKFQQRTTGRSFVYARKLFNENNPFKRKDVIDLVRTRMISNNLMKNPETVKKVIAANAGKFIGELNPFYGKKHSKKSIDIIRQKATGRKMSAASLEKRYETIRKNNRPRILLIKICPHCGLIGSGGNMTRYHFDNCITLKS